MSVLRVSPFSLVYGELVKAKVSSRNAIGWNVESLANSVGATMQTVPT